MRSKTKINFSLSGVEPEVHQDIQPGYIYEYEGGGYVYVHKRYHRSGYIFCNILGLKRTKDKSYCGEYPIDDLREIVFLNKAYKVSEVKFVFDLNKGA
jgi:hypothetical protein